MILPVGHNMIVCPQCHRLIVVEIIQVLDLDRTPDLRRQFLRGYINALRCTHCGYKRLLNQPLIIHDPISSGPILFIPNDPRFLFLIQEIKRQLISTLQASTQDYLSPEYIFNAIVCHRLDEVGKLIGQAYSEAVARADPDLELDRIIEAIGTFVNAETLLEIKKTIERFQKQLFHQLADYAFELLLEEHNDDAYRLNILKERQRLLIRCRTEGIGPVFAKLLSDAPAISGLSPEIQAIVRELSLPRQQDDLPRRIELSHQALRLIQREHYPTLWANFNFELGTSLAQNPYSDRAENIELAITAFRRVLQVKTRKDMPAEWADTMNNLAIAYLERIQGDGSENIEQVINICNEVIEMIAWQEMPHIWAKTTQILALAYQRRVQGDRGENLERAVALCEQTLQLIDKETLPIEWATIMGTLGFIYYKRIQGGKAENLELSINICEQALQIISKEAKPTEWAVILDTLAQAYQTRVRGDRTQNLTYAINIYQQILPVRTRQLMPHEWAETVNNMGVAYYSLVQGNRSENLENAIAAFQKALEVRTREARPIEWAETVNNLAAVYLYHVQGKRSENIERAITIYSEALQIVNLEKSPRLWVNMMTNFATGYYSRLEGERADNLEKAITIYRQVLQVITRELMPEEWAKTMINLGNAYQERVQGQHEENIGQAIICYQQALRVVNQENMPIEWASVTMNLANAYSARTGKQQAENLENAIDLYQKVLQIKTQQTMPDAWATATMNLARGYSVRIRGDRAENLEQAIYYYHQALQVINEQTMPEEWATAMMNLAIAYRKRVRGEKAENLRQAVYYYEQALKTRVIDIFPSKHREIQHDLGDLYFSQHNWGAALEAYTAAIKAGQVLLATAYTEIGRKAEIGETATPYVVAAYCLIQLNRPSEALYQLEQGKTRLLAEALALSGADLATLSENHRQTILATREAVRVLETEMRLPSNTPARRSDRDLAEALRLTRAELNRALEAIRVERPDFMPTGLDLPDILELIPTDGALVVPLVTSQGSAVFVIPHGVKVVTLEYVIQLEGMTDKDLNSLLIGSKTEKGWLRSYATYKHKLGQIQEMVIKTKKGQVPLEARLAPNVLTQEITEEWQNAIEHITNRLWSLLMKAIHQRLLTLNLLTSGASILLIPQGGLGLLPLHASWRKIDGKKLTFLDDYTVTYIPSSYTLYTSQQRLQQNTIRHLHSLLTVVNPTKDLTYASTEGEQVVKLFGDNCSKILAEDEATPDAITEMAVGCNYLHFSCHGFYNWQETMHSGLILANGKSLTLSDIIAKLDLSAARLVTLSACETGLTEFRQSPDEYVGLPAGFLQAGTPAVISTLWAVDDLSTMLLMERFYQYHLQDGLEIVTALCQAQLWLRDVTAAELSERFSGERQALLGVTRMPAEVINQEYRRFAKLNPDERPFAHPYYWAAFTFSGA